MELARRRCEGGRELHAHRSGRPRPLDEAQLGVTLIHPPFGPEVERARGALPEHERDDDQRRQEMPAPQHAVEPALHQNLAFRPAKIGERGALRGGAEPRIVGDVVLVEQILDLDERFDAFGEPVACGEIEHREAVERHGVVVVAPGLADPAEPGRRPPAARIAVAQRCGGLLGRDAGLLLADAQRIELVLDDLGADRRVVRVELQAGHDLPAGLQLDALDDSLAGVDVLGAEEEARRQLGRIKRPQGDEVGDLLKKAVNWPVTGPNVTSKPPSMPFSLSGVSCEFGRNTREVVLKAR